MANRCRVFAPRTKPRGTDVVGRAATHHRGLRLSRSITAVKHRRHCSLMPPSVSAGSRADDQAGNPTVSDSDMELEEETEVEEVVELEEEVEVEDEEVEEEEEKDAEEEVQEEEEEEEEGGEAKEEAALEEEEGEEEADEEPEQEEEEEEEEEADEGVANFRNSPNESGNCPRG